MTTVPPAYRATCALQLPSCAGVVDTRRKGVFRRTRGWVENRQAGGAHSVALPEPQQAWACKACITLRRKGVNSQTLWDAADARLRGHRPEWARCPFGGARCLGDVPTKAPGTYRLVEGWAEARQQGGTNTVALMAPLPSWACGHCLDDQRRGIDPGQAVLWAEP